MRYFLSIKVKISRWFLPSHSVGFASFFNHKIIHLYEIFVDNFSAKKEKIAVNILLKTCVKAIGLWMSIRGLREKKCEFFL